MFIIIHKNKKWNVRKLLASVWKWNFGKKKESKHFNYILRELQNIYKNNNKYDIKFIYIYIKIFKSLIFLRETDPVKRIVHIN